MWAKNRAVRTVTDSLCDLEEDFQATYGTIDLAPGVVGHDDALAADLVRLERVFGGLDALDDERPPARYLLPLPSDISVNFAARARPQHGPLR